ncbi:MAG TPA: hypothetical protein VFV95_20920, partial [Vicinamibacterales bacterium]|nr:hypothetical protein [Vicinamibacterales bacterium]
GIAMRLRAVLVLGLAVSVIGCEGVVFVISPTPVPAKNATESEQPPAVVVGATVTSPPPSPSPTTSGGSMARLQLSNASLLAPSGSQGWYTLVFFVTETSGASGAVIKSIRVVPPAGDSVETGETCWRSPVRVDAGSTSDAFRPGSSRVPSYCAPGVAAPVKPSFVSVTIRYIDDSGAAGAFTTRIDN